MSDEERVRNLMAGVLEEECPECRSCKPRQKSDCTIRKFLLMRKDGDLVRQIDKFLDERGCKGFVSRHG